jgi:ABC-type branched-subunit amino acid transport system ATPase component/ABC-type branched-subunit amino acid transport system permease subunit
LVTEATTHATDLTVPASGGALDALRIRLLRRAVQWHLGNRLVRTAITVGAMAILPSFAGSDDFLKYGDLFLIYSLMVMGLNLQQGYTGIVNLGPSATFGVGAYASAVISHHWHWGMPLPFLGPLVVAFFCANFFGGAALVLSKFHFTMLSFYSALLIPILAQYGGFFTGGNTGFADLEPLEFAGFHPTGWVLYEVLLGIFLIGFSVMVRIMNGRLGRAYLALKNDELAASSVGIAPRETKFGVLMIGALYGVIAGALFVHAWPGVCGDFDGATCVIGPNFFGFDLSVLLFAAVIIGGAGSRIGPLAGCAVLVIVSWYFQNHDTLNGNVQTMIYGALLIITVVALPQGLATVGRLFRLPAEVVPPAPYHAPALPSRRRQAADLVLRDLAVRFGGVVALDGVDFDVLPGEIHALIGPNGSGKTTLLNCASGVIRPQRGEVLFDGKLLPPAQTRAYRRSRMGLSRTFQTPRVQPELTVLDNVMQGLFYEARGGLLGWVPLPGSRARCEGPLRERARLFLRAVGLEHRAHLLAGTLAHGERRLVEVARALVSEPAVVLLDEPAAGLDSGEARHLVAVLRACRQWGCAVVLIEHDLSLVLGVADRVTVMDRGRVISRGTPDAVRADPAVAEAFMGPLE